MENKNEIADKENDPAMEEQYHMDFDLSRKALKSLIKFAWYHRCSLNQALNTLLIETRLIPSIKMGASVSKALEAEKQLDEDLEKYIDSLQK
ncbi:MAG: hypothetical protein J1F67_04970 [Muribaculaceae bacterium]|nr:hypothetical protein [Muribaculaceae bacterium]